MTLLFSTSVLLGLIRFHLKVQHRHQKGSTLREVPKIELLDLTPEKTAGAWKIAKSIRAAEKTHRHLGKITTHQRRRRGKSPEGNTRPRGPGARALKKNLNLVLKTLILIFLTLTFQASLIKTRELSFN